MSNTDESSTGMADTDINSTDADGTNVQEGGVAAAQGSGEDADRGNLDGSTPMAEPRDRSLDEAGTQAGTQAGDEAGTDAGGNGSFDQASPESNGAESDAYDAGQDNGLNE